MSFRWTAGLYLEIRKPLGRCTSATTTPGGGMKFLLTSAGIKNTSIHDALVDLLGKPIAESSALCIPTASYGHPMAGPPGMELHQRTRAPLPNDRVGLEVLGSAGAHRTAQ